MNRLLSFVGIMHLAGSLAHPAAAENLNKKFGPSWDCSYITAGMPIYDACKPCQDKGMDFWKDSETTGHCVPKEGEEEASEEPPQVPATQKKKETNYSYIIRTCNKTGEELFVAMGTNDAPKDVHATLRGWWKIANGQCKDSKKLPFGNNLSQVAFLHAQSSKKFWPTKAWPADESWDTEGWLAHREAKVNFCVTMKTFEWVTGPESSFSCPDGQEKRAFDIVWIEREEKPITVKQVDFE